MSCEHFSKAEAQENARRIIMLLGREKGEGETTFLKTKTTGGHRKAQLERRVDEG